MTQEDKLINIIENHIKSIKDKLESYKKVDATLSYNTLIETAAYLNVAEEKLESGFIKDACDEINRKIIYN